MRTSLLVALVPCVVLAACSRADNDRIETTETPMSAPAAPEADRSTGAIGDGMPNPGTPVPGPNGTSTTPGATPGTTPSTELAGPDAAPDTDGDGLPDPR